MAVHSSASETRKRSCRLPTQRDCAGLAATTCDSCLLPPRNRGPRKIRLWQTTTCSMRKAFCHKRKKIHQEVREGYLQWRTRRELSSALHVKLQHCHFTARGTLLWLASSKLASWLVSSISKTSSQLSCFFNASCAAGKRTHVCCVSQDTTQKRYTADG